MGKYQGIVDEAVLLGGNISAVDFTEYDEVTEKFPDQGGDETGDDVGLIRGSTFAAPVRTEDGVLLDGIEEHLRWRLSSEQTLLRTALLIFKQSEPFTGTLFESGDGLSGSFDFRTYSYSDGRILGDVGSGTDTTVTSPLDTIQIGEICHVMLVNAGSNSKVYFGVNSETAFEPIGVWDTVTGSSLYTSIGATRNQFGFNKVEVLFYAAWNYEVPQEDLQSLLSQFGTYGFVTLPTNLESSRIQSALALGPNREFNNSVSVPVGVTDLAINISVEPGQLVEFFAFDSDEAKTNLTTGPVAPSPQEPLIFNPVAGSGGTDPGTGLIAHIAGTVDIDGTAAERQVIVISDDPNGRQVLGEGMSAPDGTFDIEYNDWGGAVIALAVDNYGGDWAAETPIASGTIIHPTTPNGYVYEATSGGSTGTEEPTWSINGAVNDGSVTWDPKPFYRPIASGPIKGEVLEEGTPTEPEITPYRFFRIIITDNNNSGTGYTAISEIELRAEENGTDLTTPSTIITSTSVYPANNNYPVAAMLDNDFNTVWLSEVETLPITITLDMGSEVSVSHLVMIRGGADVQSNLDQAPKAFSVEASNDATTWVELNNFVGIIGWVANEPRSFLLATS